MHIITNVATNTKCVSAFLKEYLNDFSKSSGSLILNTVYMCTEGQNSKEKLFFFIRNTHVYVDRALK